jgi:hypothetical protein
MGIDQMDVVDFIGCDRATDEVVLIIADHLPWTDDEEENFDHMDLLQQKIYRYLDFIESGEINESYPEAIGRRLRLQIVAKYDLSKEALEFFNKIRNYLVQQGYKLEFQRHMADEPSDGR